MAVNSSCSDEGASSQQGKSKPRQQPGPACEECRARKLRCNREQPQCSTCRSLDVQCTRNKTHQPRGPKRGYLRALQSRLSALESRLGENQEANASPQPGEPQPRTSVDAIAEWPPEAELGESMEPEVNASQQMNLDQNEQDFSPSDLQDNDFTTVAQSTAQHPAFPGLTTSLPAGLGNEPSVHRDPYPNLASTLEMGPEFGNFFQAGSSLPGDGSRSSGTALSSELSLSSTLGCPTTVPTPDLMRADLDHLYFDRVHHFVPLMNQSRYFARAARSSAPVDPFSCLQHAMWTLAASMGTQFQHIQPTLYSQTRSALECWEPDMINESIPIEHVQAWILLAMYELTQGNPQRGWISAGRCFRLVYFMKLHEVDNPRAWVDAATANLSWVEVEERRRAFWAAYSLDRYANLINQLPLTLNEQVILTRLPAPEVAFQRQQPIQTEFLSQVATEGSTEELSPFAKSIILLTISGRCLSHQLQCNAERVHNSMSQEFLKRHQWLDSILSQKTQAMSLHTAVDDEPLDPMNVFTDMAAQATVCLLSTALESVQSNMHQHQEAMSSYNGRAMVAAQRMSSLAQKLAQLGYFKVHPITPIFLYLCAQFARSRQAVDERYGAIYQMMTTALRDLCLVNNLAKTCLQKASPEASDRSSAASSTSTSLGF